MVSRDLYGEKTTSSPPVHYLEDLPFQLCGVLRLINSFSSLRCLFSMFHVCALPLGVPRLCQRFSTLISFHCPTSSNDVLGFSPPCCQMYPLSPFERGSEANVRSSFFFFSPSTSHFLRRTPLYANFSLCIFSILKVFFFLERISKGEEPLKYAHFPPAVGFHPSNCKRPIFTRSLRGSPSFSPSLSFKIN